MEEKRKREGKVDVDPLNKRVCAEVESGIITEDQFEDILIINDSDTEDLDNDCSISSNASVSNLYVKSTRIKKLRFFNWRNLSKFIFPCMQLKTVDELYGEESLTMDISGEMKRSSVKLTSPLASRGS